MHDDSESQSTQELASMGRVAGVTTKEAEQWFYYWFNIWLDRAFKRPFSIETEGAERWFTFWFKCWAIGLWRDAECSPADVKKSVLEGLEKFFIEVFGSREV